MLKLVKKFAFAAAEDEKIGGKEQLKVLKIFVKTICPFGAADLQTRARAGGTPAFGRFSVFPQQVTQLGVGDQAEVLVVQQVSAP